MVPEKPSMRELSGELPFLDTGRMDSRLPAGRHPPGPPVVASAVAVDDEVGPRRARQA